jgi:serine/threonine protein phosphatase PrpC
VVVPATGTQDVTVPEDDISLAPTQILTPQEMLAFQSRRWQHETEQNAKNDAASATEETNATLTDEQKTVASQPLEQNTSSPVAAEKQPSQVSEDVADMPTRMMSPQGDVVEGGPMQIPPPPPEFQQAADNDPNVSAYAEQAAAPPASVTPPDAETPPPAPTPEAQPTPASVSEQTQTPATDQSGTNETNASTEASTALPIGTLVAGRYEIVQLVSEDEQEHVYSVIDHQGYQHCWNCGSEENAEGDEFCINCGAELLNANYLMHEYSATTSGDKDARVLQGTIANTFVEQGKTYVIEQQHAAQIAFPNGVHILAASDSDAGNVRRSEPNEDSTLVLQLQRVHESQATPIGVFIIADGMGGHDNGQGASRMTVNVIADKVVRELLSPPLIAEKSGGLTASVQPMEEDSLIALFKGAVEDANNVLVQTNQHDKTDMGSTITGFMIVGDSAYVINVGDSRTYMLREGTLYQLTTDHSLVGQLVAGGLIEPDDVYTHPQRSQIFRSLGDKMNVQIDDFKQQLLPGDILISCSDGLWEMVRNPQITDILNNAHDPQTACSQLIDAANANGGEDNVSAAIVFVR